MDGNEDYFLVFLGVLLTAFVLTGGILGWIAFFQVRKLKQEWDGRSPAQTPPVLPAVTVFQPAADVSLAAVPAATADTQPAPPAVPVNLPPGHVNRPPRGYSRPAGELPEWQRRLLENWTGLVGLAVVLLGLGFLAVYGAAVLTPFGRFLLITAAAAVSLAGGMALVKYQPRWTRWGYWLQSFGAAVFLVGCLGSGGIPGVAWVTDPLAGLGLLLLGIAVNLVLGSYRRRQPYLTLHVVLSLVALSVAEPAPLIILALWTTAFLGLALSWFQRWSYHRAVTVTVVQAIFAAAYWRATPDPVLQWLALGASASLAILVHIASYRRLEGVWSRPTFVTHVLNALAASVPCALWAPKLPLTTALVLTAVFVGLVLLSLRSKSTETTWLYRTDRVLALAVAGIVLLLNPLSTSPVLLGAVFVLLSAVLAWSARAENDKLLTQVGLAMMTVGLGALAFVSLFHYREDTAEWLWQTAAVLLAALAAGAFSATAKEGSVWHTVLDALLPPAFLLPLAVLWLGNGSPVSGLSPGWVFAVPAGALAVLARLRGRDVLAWSLMATAAFTVLGSWSSWAGQGRLWGTWLPTLIWGAGATLPAIAAILASPPRTSRFLAASLFALGSTALLVWLTLEPIHPAYSMLGISALFLLVLVLNLERFHPGLASSSTLVLTVALAVARLAWALQAPVGWIALGCDAVVAGLLAAAALNRRTGQSVFWEACLIWLVWTIWFDLPGNTLGLGIAVLAVAALAAGRALPRPRLDWYSAIAFLLAAAVCLTTGSPVLKGTTLAVLAAYLVLDSLWKPVAAPGWQTSLKPVRRYVLVFVQAAILALCLPDFLDSRVLTFGWSLEAALVFFLAVVWKDEIFKNTALAGLGVCLIRLIWVDLSASDVLTKAITFLSVGGLMVGMNVLYLWSKNRSDKTQP